MVSGTGCEIEIFFFAENGVTIKANEIAETGMQSEFNGNIYTVVSEQQLRQMVNNGDDLTYVVTSKVTDMSNLFDGINYNNDISHWAVSYTHLTLPTKRIV